MTAIDHHSVFGDSNRTNSTIATVKCVCAAVVAAAVVVFDSVADGSACQTRLNSCIDFFVK